MNDKQLEKRWLKWMYAKGYVKTCQNWAMIEEAFIEGFRQAEKLKK